MVGLQVTTLVVIVIFASINNHIGIVIATEQSNNNGTVVTLNPTIVEDVETIWPNRTRRQINQGTPDSKDSHVVDCLGLGKPVAKLLTGWFTSKKNISHAWDVGFWISTRNSRDRVQMFTGDGFSLESTDFAAERRTFVIVHGFMSNAEKDWIKEMEDALLAMEDVNVIVIGWAPWKKSINYYKAVVYTKMVGTEIARFLHQIVNATIAANPSEKPQWGKLHLVGHSLGAHICGIAADRFRKRQNSWMVHRITGLDPAHPCYKNMNMTMKLDVDDAPFVDVIHTNGRQLTKLGLGLPDPIGHVDFYPNGGGLQPGCTRSKKSFLDYIPTPKSLLKQATCSHRRAAAYFTASIIAAIGNNCTFWANNWDSSSCRRTAEIMSETCDSTKCTEMGIHAENYSQRGTYFVLTSKSSPFCDPSLQDREEVEQRLRKQYKCKI